MVIIFTERKPQVAIHVGTYRSGWRTCGLASEILAQVAEHVPPSLLKENCVRVTLPDAPAPTSRALERLYYSSKDDVVAAARSCVGNA